MRSFPYYKQLNAMDCGPTCLRMIAGFYGQDCNIDTLRDIAGYGKEGVSLFGISEAAEKIGFRTTGVLLSFEQLMEANLPCVLHWDQGHFVVLPPLGKRQKKKGVLRIADPAAGPITLLKSEFLGHWISTTTEEGEHLGAALLLEPTPELYKETTAGKAGLRWRFVLQYLYKCRGQLLQVALAAVFATVLQLVLPFLTQSIVDIGIGTQNLQYITIVLIAQMMLLLSKSLVDFIRTRLLMRVSIMVNLSILSDFWIKVSRLPIHFFDSRQTGDIMQRITDNKQVQNFLTGSIVSTFFSGLNFLVYGALLGFYNLSLFLLFFIGSALYFGWIIIFLKIRRNINYETFKVGSKENNATLEFVQGMADIRLNNSERAKRWEWERIQSRIFNLNFKTLRYNQYQQAGALLINQGKDILITFLSASLVVEGKITLGAMVAIQFIVGQLSSPIEQFISFIQEGQDAKISLERLNDIHRLKDEEDPERVYIKVLPEDNSIRLKNVSFGYPGSEGDAILQNINIEIPENRVTAIVGMSGSGKTTLLKLLLKFYDKYEGEIRIGETNLKNISHSFWRSQCGAVMQEGYIFNDSIARNIAVGSGQLDYQRLLECCKITNILTFIESLPNGFGTQIGSGGISMSQGQKQRLLISRSVYRNPRYFFFDEATNALDSNNERLIIGNLERVFAGRTVIVVAHRLSTVVNADKIIVLNKGEIVESGCHLELISQRGQYYELIRNQLELGL